METMMIIQCRHRAFVALTFLVASAIACSSQPVPLPTSTPPGQVPLGPIPTGAPAPPAQPAEPVLPPGNTEPTETFILADTVAAPTETIPDSGEPVLLGPPIRYLPLDPPAGRDPITAQGTIEEHTTGDGVAQCTVTYGTDNPPLNRVATVRYDAMLAPTVSKATDVFREATSPLSPDNPDVTTFGQDTLTACPRADECAQWFATSVSQNVTIIVHAFRTQNLVVLVWLQAQGADGTSWLREEMPYYLSLVVDKLPAR